MILVSGEIQGRIFTSSSQGLNGISYGYFNRNLFATSNPSENLNKLGGESRMWFGPEIGKNAIFFEPGTAQNANTIFISPQLKDKPFKIIEHNDHSITSGNQMQISNANGYVFELDIVRKIGIKTSSQIKQDLQLNLPAKVSKVAFYTETTIKNMSTEIWSKENGLLSIWDLSCILPSPKSMVIIPSKNEPDSAVIYFTPNDEKRINVTNRHIYYKADAAYMNKIRIQTEHCKDVFSSYAPELNRLNIVKYRLNKDGTYVNSLWDHTYPYKGEVINVFNGKVNEEFDRNWPFYELETSSEAKELNLGESQNHMHSVYHFEGDFEELNEISMTVLGTELKRYSNFKFTVAVVGSKFIV